jgi:uroporphyrinogen-III synthase
LCAGISPGIGFIKVFNGPVLDSWKLSARFNLNCKELKIRKILVSQPEPLNPKSPYFDLAKKYNLKIEFKPFVQVEGIPSKDFRHQKINILDFSAVIFTSKTGIDHFFRVCNELRVTVPDNMKYFCITENVAFYLQKYIVYRKRKIFHGRAKFQDLIDVIVKHKDDNFFVPLSEPHNAEIPDLLDKNSIKYTIGTLYKTISTDFSSVKNFDYDILVFYSPSGIKSLKENFPDFVQGEIKIAAFGPTTACAVEQEGLRLDINAPNPKAPSMTMALDNFLKDHNRNSK